MSRINHSRPSLRLADNIRRELNKYRPDSIVKSKLTKTPKVAKANLWQKMNAIGLSKKEENLLLDLIELASSSFENLGAKLEQARLSKKAVHIESWKK